MLVATPRNPDVIRQFGTYPRALNLLSRKKTAVQRQLRREGLAGYEPITQATLLALAQVAPRPVEFFDVGAHIGLYSALISSIFGSKAIRATAFEPTPEVAQICTQIAKANHLSIQIERVAVSSENGQATLFLSDKSESSNSLEPKFKRSSASIAVPTVTLDSFCKSTGRLPAVLKIDVETHESSVIRGALATITDARPSVVCELLPKADPDLTRSTLRDLASLNYRMYRWSDGAWQKTAARDVLAHLDGRGRDWLLIPEETTPAFLSAFNSWRIAIKKCSQTTIQLLSPGTPLPVDWDAPHNTRPRISTIIRRRQPRVKQ